MNKLRVGSKVLCQYYNTPDKKFYGDFFEGEIIKIQLGNNREKLYTIQCKYDIVNLYRKEIKRIIK
jgi:hypothetical protein